MGDQELLSILARVEPLPASQRDTEVALFALSLPSSSVPVVIRQLSAGSPYEQRLATVVARTWFNADWINESICDSDPYLHIPALRAALARPHLVNDEVLRAALDDASAAHRGVLLRAMSGRPALADSIVHGIREDWGDATSGDLLASCSAEVVSDLLPGMLHAIKQWRPLVRSHPAIVLEALVADRASTAIDNSTWWTHYDGALSLLLDRAPKELNAGTVILDLVEKYPGILPSSIRARLPSLARLDPKRVINLFLSTPGCYPGDATGNMLRLFARSAPNEFKVYINKLDVWMIPDLLKQLAPSDRPAVCETILERFATLPEHMELTAVLDVLPQKYATRVAHDAVVTMTKRNPQDGQILEIKSYLQTLLRTSFSSPRVNLTPTGAVARVAEQLAKRLKNEQIPVRVSVFWRLDAVPAKLLSVDALPHLLVLAQNTLEARDVQSQEWSRLAYIAFHAVCAHPGSEAHRTFATDIYAKLDRFDRHTRSPPMDQLPPGHDREIYEFLAPMLDDQLKRNDYAIFFSFTDALAQRAEAIPELQARLVAALKSESIRDYDLRKVINLYLGNKRTRSARVAEVLSLHPSAIIIPIVAEVVSSSRTDLLALDQTPRGRLIADDAVWSFKPRCAHDLRRWSPAQRAGYIAQLQATAEDTASSQRDRVRAIRGLGTVAVGLDHVRKWADDEDVPLAEAGLCGLSSSPDDLPLLLSYAGGDRARVAIYAADGASRFVEPSVLHDTLSVLLARNDAKVTSRKAAVRLAAHRLPAAQAASLLASIVAAESTHSDVRAACVSATTAHLISTQAGWKILLEAATKHNETARRAILTREPLDLPLRHRIKYAALICALASDGDDAIANIALTKLVTWAPYASSAGEVMRKQALDMARAYNVWTTAARGLVSISNTDSGREVSQALNALLSLHVDGLNADIDESATEAEDLAAYDRVQAIMNAFPSDKAYASAIAAAADALRAHGEIYLASTALVKLIDWQSDPVDPWSAITVLKDIITMCARAPATGYMISQTLLDHLPKDHKATAHVVLGAAETLTELSEAESAAGAGTQELCGVFAVALTSLFLTTRGRNWSARGGRGGRGRGGHAWGALGPGENSLVRKLMRRLRKSRWVDVREMAFAT